jgi:hypothetical protein
MTTSEFPIYRKYSNEKSYFKVISESEFEEIQVLGKSCSIHQFEAKILPDRNYVQDLIANDKGHWIEIEANEYEEKLRWCDSL